MRMMRLVTTTLVLVGLLAPVAHAQDRQKIGLLIATPAVVGLDWEITPRLALRPDFAFAHNTITDAIFAAQTSHSRTGSVGISALFYVRRSDLLRIYLSPRYAHQLSRDTGSFNSTQSESEFVGSIGGQYELAPRFGVFAEAGLRYTTWRLTAGGTSGVSTSATLANAASVGAILFF